MRPVTYGFEKCFFNSSGKLQLERGNNHGGDRRGPKYRHFKETGELLQDPTPPAESVLGTDVEDAAVFVLEEDMLPIPEEDEGEEVEADDAEALDDQTQPSSTPARYAFRRHITPWVDATQDEARIQGLDEAEHVAVTEEHAEVPVGAPHDEGGTVGVGTIDSTAGEAVHEESSPDRYERHAAKLVPWNAAHALLLWMRRAYRGVMRLSMSLSPKKHGAVPVGAPHDDRDTVEVGGADSTAGEAVHEESTPARVDAAQRTDGSGRKKRSLPGWPETPSLAELSGSLFWSSQRYSFDEGQGSRGPRTPPIVSRYMGAFALAGLGFQALWEKQASKSMEDVRAKMGRRPIPGVASTALEKIAFEQGLDQLKQLGFVVKGIISDEGGSFKAAIIDHNIEHQMDVWHKGRNLTRRFIHDFIDAKKPSLRVSECKTIADVWAVAPEHLHAWLLENGYKGRLSKGSSRESLVQAVCAILKSIPYQKMKATNAVWKYPLMRKVLRLRQQEEGGSIAERGSGGADTDATGGPQADGQFAEERGDMEDVQWDDVSEMFGYDPHPVHGVRPCSETSFLLIQASISSSDRIVDAPADAQSDVQADVLADVPSVADQAQPATLGGSCDENINPTAQQVPPGQESGTDAVAREIESTVVGSGSRPCRRQERGVGKRSHADMMKMATDDLGMDEVVTEVNVGQRWSVHFHHCMVRAATLARDGRPMSAKDVADELALCADHWAGLHAGCDRGDVPPRCVRDKWGEESAIYPPGSQTHIDLKKWLQKHCSEEAMRPYVLGAGSWLNESFHSLICKYAPKRVRFLGSMEARIALAVLHWNNTVTRVVRAYKERMRRATRTLHTGPSPPSPVSNTPPTTQVTLVATDAVARRLIPQFSARVWCHPATTPHGQSAVYGRTADHALPVHDAVSSVSTRPNNICDTIDWCIWNIFY
ncbi:unnamed protein product [Closterium sp. Yama58-4]|nr:unnamed protein product [Closterium sp. Yama58-4]